MSLRGHIVPWMLAFFLCLGLAAAVAEGAVPLPEDLRLRWRDRLTGEFADSIADDYPFPECFRSASRRHRIPLALLLSVARGESDFNPRAVSEANCHGVMQIKWPITARELGFRDLTELHDPCRNIMAGAEYLRKMLDMHKGDVHLALAAYNRGPGRVHAGIALRDVPEEGNQYSDYIGHHFEKIVSRYDRRVKTGIKEPYKRSGKLPIIAFDWEFRVKLFIAYVNSKEPAVRLEWFKTPADSYAIVMLFENATEKANSIRRLGKIGFKVDEAREF